MVSVPEFGRRTYLTLIAALAAAGACAWVGALLVLRPHAAFAAAWTLMTVAALLPSSAPMVATYASLRRSLAGTGRALAGAAAFVGGYLLTWAAAGVVVYLVSVTPDEVEADRWVDAGVLALAAAYELTQLKQRCLATCRVPLSFALTSWRDGLAGALDMGARYGFRCVGACAALVLALFALEPDELGGLAAVAAVVALQKLAPGRTVIVRGTALLLAALALAVAVGGTSG